MDIVAKVFVNNRSIKIKNPAAHVFFYFQQVVLSVKSQRTISKPKGEAQMLSHNALLAKFTLTACTRLFHLSWKKNMRVVHCVEAFALYFGIYVTN